MKKLLAVLIIFLFFGMIIFPSSGIQIEQTTRTLLHRGNTLYVGGNGSGNYTTIQSAVDDASDGDTVFVYDDSSPYFGSIVIDKSINLIGENKDTTVIIRYPYFRIFSDNVVVSGFTITGIGGIEICSDNNIIEGNKILNDYFLIIDSNYNTIANNSFYNIGVELADFGNIISGNSFFNAGILIFSTYQKIVSNNTVNNKPLIYLENKSDIVIESEAGQVILVNCNNITVQNQEIDNTTFGIELLNSDNCFIINNNINSNNYSGIFLANSHNNNILSNNLTNNDDSIELHISDRNIITENKIHNNLRGIDIDTSNRNTISKNDIKNNDKGIIHHDSELNSFTKNNFINNKIHASFIKLYQALWEFIINNQINKNIWKENYWNKPRVLPKIIFGEYIIIINNMLPIFALGMEFDWSPAKNPYDIK